MRPLALFAVLGVAVVPFALGRPRRRTPLAPPPLPEPSPPAPPRAPVCDGAFVVPRSVPQEIALRAREILFTSAPLGSELVEEHGGEVWKFIVETHGPDARIPFPHRGVGVRVCVGRPPSGGAP